ncbi:MMPL family transporter [Amycolatopsis rhizosphaerae]|uniref:MMPL family transporter n=1 Tax=Amycolatopsis rhizosphaerae TaxID=2053003 RepID=A0A558CXK2_9PSEU|nr:MMPL family transporter [Amycolatopsis rhizosphaerae]TVT53502.1 MMPL family transporter [Amycolatopsis rhizosphaerae]
MERPRDTTSAPRRFVLPVLIVLGWLALGFLTLPYLGKLGEVTTNDAGSFLPSRAESTAVQKLTERFAKDRLLPTVLVFEHTGGLTGDDSAAIAAKTAELARMPGLAGPPTPPLASPDGQAVEVILPVSGQDPFQAGKDVAHLRTLLPVGLPPGLRALATGPGGYNADFAEVFGGIDGMLLLVTAGVVAFILVVVYRSPLLPVVVLISAGLALGTASALIYWLTRRGVLTLNGQTQGILLILVFGAATDYALLVVARYREELLRTRDTGSALRRALRTSVEPVGASGGTVILAMLCLLFSELTSNRSLGPVASIGIAGALAASLSFLPAALALLGRAAFWPARPVPVKHRRSTHGIFDGIARLVHKRPRASWLVTSLVLAAGLANIGSLSASGTSQEALFLRPVDAVTGGHVLAAHFPGGTGSPALITAKAGALPRILDMVKTTGGIVDAVPATEAGAVKTVDGMVEISATLRDPADSAAALETVGRLRTAVHAVPGADARVGGQTAQQADLLAAATHDRDTIIPIVLVAIFVILALLLRSLVAPVLLMATVVLSFGATLGVGAFVFGRVFRFPGADPSIPLYAFVFLVALGIDYNIFLMTRAREEAARDGTVRGTLTALKVTGGVITSAGVVLAATFAALSVIPVLFLAQIAFLVAFGVLLDTFVVRSLLVPALAVDAGRIIWWPGRPERSLPSPPAVPPVVAAAARAPRRADSPRPRPVTRPASRREK